MSRSNQTVAQWIMNTAVRRNAALTAVLFGVYPHKGKRIYWDFTTIVLRNALRGAVKDGMRVLEVGAGPYALLALFIERHYRCGIEACDINQSYVEEAAAELAKRRSTIHVFQSDLFANTVSKYDLIYSNTLYIPRNEGRRRGLGKLHTDETDWCGGETGYEYIDRLLTDAPSFLAPEGKLLLGFNSFYLDEGKIRVLCIEHSYNIVYESKNKLNPGRVYTLAYIPGCSYARHSGINLY